MPAELLDLELKLLLLKHGRTRVIDTLARIQQVSSTQLEEQLAAISNSRVPRKPKSLPTLEQCIERLNMPDGLRKERIVKLARDFEQKRFLPEARAAEHFCAKHGVKFRAKSRKEALPKIIAVVSQLSDHELEELSDHSSGSANGGGFAQLADAIIRS